MGCKNSSRRSSSGVVILMMIVIIMEFASSSMAYKFFVGGKDGWVLNPSEKFNHWAQRNRFQVNDTLLFKQKESEKTVLVVKKEDYYSCNTTSPKSTLTGAEFVYRLDHSGPFFFISGDTQDCHKGLRLHIIVMAVRTKQPVSPAQSPASDNQRVDPSSLDDSPSPAPGKQHRSAASPRTGNNKLFALVVVMISLFVGFVI